MPMTELILFTFYTIQVRAVMGPQSYMLQTYELLWKKELDPVVEEMLK